MTEEEVRERLAMLRARRATLFVECRKLSEQIPAIRAAFGNPFSYSKPTGPEEGPQHFTGFSSHELVYPTLSELVRVQDEIEQLKKSLGAG